MNHGIDQQLRVHVLPRAVDDPVPNYETLYAQRDIDPDTVIEARE